MLLTVSETARVLGISSEEVLKLVSGKTLSSMRVRGEILIASFDVAMYQEEQRRKSQESE